MTQQHLITPPPELVQQWTREYDRMDPRPNIEPFIATRAAQWGADQELEACCDWLSDFAPHTDWPVDLLIARRPKPPSLKEQALALIELIQGSTKPWQLDDLDVVRRALEQLPDSEPSGNSR